MSAPVPSSFTGSPELRQFRQLLIHTICPHIKQWSDAEDVPQIGCEKCPATVETSQGTGVQMCRLNAEKAADDVLAIIPPARILGVAQAEQEPTPYVAWIAFAGNGNIRFWTDDYNRCIEEKRRGLDLRAFTLVELVALARGPVRSSDLADRLEADASRYSREHNGHMPLHLAVTEVDAIVASLRGIAYADVMRGALLSARAALDNPASPSSRDRAFEAINTALAMSSTPRATPTGPWAEGCPNYPGCKCDDVCIDWGGSPISSTDLRSGK